MEVVDVLLYDGVFGVDGFSTFEVAESFVVVAFEGVGDGEEVESGGVVGEELCCSLGEAAEAGGVFLAGAVLGVIFFHGLVEEDAEEVGECFEEDGGCGFLWCVGVEPAV